MLKRGILVVLLIACVGAAPPSAVMKALNTYADYSTMDVRGGVGVFFHCDPGSIQSMINKVNADADMDDFYKGMVDAQLYGPQAAACALQERNPIDQWNDVYATTYLATIQAIMSKKQGLSNAAALGKLAHVLAAWLTTRPNTAEAKQAEHLQHLLDTQGL